MDENEFKVARNDMVQIPCVFEKSILSHRVLCIKSRKKNIAEREAICCSDDASHERCDEWMKLLRSKAKFAIKMAEADTSLGVLPHGKEMKVQVGGIIGLAELFGLQGVDDHKGKRGVLFDVSETLNRCDSDYKNLEQLPFTQILKSVARFKLR